MTAPTYRMTQETLTPSVPIDPQQANAELARATPAQYVLPSMAASLELSSSAAAAPKDRFSSMLPELLSKVFALSDYSKPISGPLLAFTRVNRYRHIHIRTHKQLQALCDVIATRAQLGSFVKTLVIRPQGTEQSPKNRELVALYHSMKKLEGLEVSGRLVDLILSHEIASTCFPRLEMLDLDHPFQQYGNSLDPMRFSCIKHYRELTFVKVSICCYGCEDGADDDGLEEDMVLDDSGREGEEEEEEYRGGDEEESEVDSDGKKEEWAAIQRGVEHLGERLACATLQDDCGLGRTSEDFEDDYSDGTILQLHLTAPASDPRTLKFVGCFTSLLSISLNDSAHYDSDFTPFLSSYNRASFIERLCLSSYTDEGTEVNPENDIDVSLKRFTALESLVLHTPNFSSAIYQHLRDPLPLTHLTIGPVDAYVSIPDLKALFLPGPTRLTSLQSLSVDVPYPGEGGTRISDEGPYYYPGSHSPEIHPDWSLPLWFDEDDFDLDEVETLQSLAETAGATLYGSVIGAMHLMEDWYCEHADLEEWDEEYGSEEWDDSENGDSDEFDVGSATEEANASDDSSYASE